MVPLYCVPLHKHMFPLGQSLEAAWADVGIATTSAPVIKAVAMDGMRVDVFMTPNPGRCAEVTEVSRE